MAPATIPQAATGPHPSYIQVAKPFLYQIEIENRLVVNGVNPTREDNFRIQGVNWINEVREALQLPVRTFCTASVYYHRFRLAHRDNEYQFHDAAAAALLAACKMEDTLKKSKEILCMAYNLKSTSGQTSPDDPLFEQPSKIVIGLERLILESSSFDFRVRYPHKHLFKLSNLAGLDQDVRVLGYKVLMDLYRTFAPLKQTCMAMCFASLELATLLLEKQQGLIRGPEAPEYRKLSTTRESIMETILDLLEHYTHFHKRTSVGRFYEIDKFVNVQIKANEELEKDKLPRYTNYDNSPKPTNFKSNIKTPKTPITPASPSDIRINGKDVASPGTLSPRSAGSGWRGAGARGQEGTVRFMLDAEKAKQEKATVDEYHKIEYEEVEVEIEEPIKNNRDSRFQDRNGRDDRYQNNHYKKPRYN